MNKLFISAHFILFALLFSLAAASGCGEGESHGNNVNNVNNVNNLNNNSNLNNTSNNNTPICGNGRIEAPEACDDGDLDAEVDGCPADCSAVDPDFACPEAGLPCVRIVVCGNARIEGDETCDDRNTEPGDGCDATCHIEPGWICPVLGAACVAERCGDGILAGFETCDDDNTGNGDGCDATCHIEEGWECVGLTCTPTVCGDGQVDVTEECDDGNDEVGDGCAPTCKMEPKCTDGVCVAVCGDGIVWAPEECDDGNTLDGDGCSSTCTEEVGFDCVEIAPDPPAQILLPVTLRDFLPACGTGARLTDTDVGAVAPFGHQDFECYTGDDIMFGNVEDTLDTGGKPVRVPNPVTFSDASFTTWFRSDADYNRTFSMMLPLNHLGSGVYRFESAAHFPLDGLGFVVEDCGGGVMCEPVRIGHNFSFTTEIHYWFQYAGDEVLDFTGDDDVWVFINGHLAVDVGGMHPPRSGSVTLSTVAATLGLTVGGVYEAVVFHAERHTDGSNYMLTLTNFNRAPSVCASDCGDGVVASDEACDDGVNNGDYGTCNPDCSFAPYCGDNHVDTEDGEICDDGINLGGNASACAPGCRSLGATCGDGVLQPANGEQCDDGNTLDGDGCTSDCRIVVD